MPDNVKIHDQPHACWLRLGDHWVRPMGCHDGIYQLESKPVEPPAIPLQSGVANSCETTDFGDILVTVTPLGPKKQHVRIERNAATIAAHRASKLGSHVRARRK